MQLDSAVRGRDDVARCRWLLHGSGKFRLVYEEGYGCGGLGDKRFEPSTRGWDGHWRLPSAADLHRCTDAGNASKIMPLCATIQVAAR